MAAPPPRISAVAIVVAAVLLGGLTGCAADDPAAVTGPRPTSGAQPMVDVVVGQASPLRVEIADTTAERRLGLMHREQLEPGTGMIFLFPSAREGAFWMYQTLIPLSIAWANDGRVVGIAEMEPCPESDPDECPRYPAPTAFDVAIEAPAGTFTEAAVQAGDEIRLEGALPTPVD